MRKYVTIDLNTRAVNIQELQGEAIARAGRNFIARTLVDKKIAKVEPLSPENPLIFSAGPFAGSNFSNANRLSVGCKSPLTGGIKEANAGGTFAFALGQLHIAAIALHGASPEWIIMHVAKDGAITFHDAKPYLGRRNHDIAAELHDVFGRKTSVALCGPVGEYQGLLAGISFSDTDRRPSRLAARGGVGAVMGSKRVKAIVVDMDKMPAFHDRKKVMGAIREYASKLDQDAAIEAYRLTGTAMMADYTNHIGGLPVRNFRSGQLVDTDVEPMTMGGDYIRELNVGRGGEPTHACMPGCMIQCSNVYVDANGEEIVSPVEYETLGLMGTNCGISDPDDLARLNFVANDLGIDSIEVGAMLGVLMEAGLADFGDVDFMMQVLEEIGIGSENGRLWAQGTARVGTHYNVARVPVIKNQAISAYDPRVIEVTGITMRVTAQGADHTAGSVPKIDSRGKAVDELVTASMEAQVVCAAADSLGLCIFGRSVTNTNIELITDALNNALGTGFTPQFLEDLGRETLRLEEEFNRAAGFGIEDDDLPSFFHEEPLPPTDRMARFQSSELHASIKKWWQGYRN